MVERAAQRVMLMRMAQPALMPNPRCLDSPPPGMMQLCHRENVVQFINESYEVRSFAAHACHRLRLLCGPIASRTRIGKHERHGPGKVARRRRRLRRSSKTQTHTENSKPGCKTPTRVSLLWSVPPSLDLFLGKSNLITERDSPELR